MADYLEPVVVELEGRDRKLIETLTRAKAEVRRFTADVARMDATIKVDVNLRDGALAEIRRRISDGPAAKLKVDLQLAAGQRDQLRAQLEGRPITANVRPVMDQTALRRVQTVLRELGRRIDVQIRPDMDTGAQRRAQRRLDRMSQDRTVVIRTRVIGDTNRLPAGGGRDGGGGGGALGAVMTLAPALVPIAADATAVAAQLGAATVAVGAFGLAVKAQLSSVTGLADAQGKVNEAVAKYGAGSQQAAQAQQAWSQAMEAMPAQTLKAAGAFMVLKQDFQTWSNSLAKFTMVPVTQGIGVLDALLPKLSPLVKDTAGQFTRLTTLLAGGVNSGAFDGLMAKFTAFANGALNSAVNGVIHFTRVLAQGGGNNTFSQFMAYAKANAPLVKETLKNIAEAVLNILKAASQAGPGMLTLVNAFAKLVAALPPSLIATLMQVAAAIKLIGLTRTGITALAGPLQTMGTRLSALRAAASAAGGGLAGLRAAFASLGTATKATVIVAALAAVGVAVAKLASLGQKAPPDVDKLTNSLGRLGTTGQVNGEALNAFGKNLNGLRDAVKSFVAPSVLDNIQQGIIKVFSFGTTDSTPVKEAKENIQAIDQALANLVQNGHADLAAVALDKLKAAYAKGGHDVTNFTKNLGQYKKAVDDAKFAQELAAESQGLFGQQALSTQKALDAQKASADGLRQSIQALNDVNRAGLGGMIGFEASIDAATKAAKDNAGALSMHNGVLDLNSAKAQAAATALNDLAQKTDEAGSAQREAGASWETVNGIYSRGRSQLIKNAEAMGLSKSQAQALAGQLLKIPTDIKSKFSMEKEDATRDLDAFNAAVKRTPDTKSVTLKALSSGAEQILESFGLKVKRLPNGKVTVTTKNGQALSAIANVAAALNRLNGKTATTWTYHNIKTTHINEIITTTKGSVHDVVGATGGLVSRLPRRASGGAVQAMPDGGYVHGPGTGTSDSILAFLPSGPVGVSNTEYVVKASSVHKYGVKFLDALNAGTLKIAGYAKGGLTQAAKDARSQLAGSFGISSFGRMAGYWRTPFEHSLAVPTDINALVSSLNGVRAEIKKAFSGKTESSLLKQLDRAGKSLISYDKQLTKVTSSLASAKQKLDDLKSAAAQLKSSVASSVMQNAGIVTQAPQEGFTLTSQDVLNNMSAEVSKSLTFSNQLQELKKRGLSADLLEQIASAGVDQGGATATALAGASDATLKQLNSMQKQLKTSANKAGSAVSDSMYGAGIRATEGLIKGLTMKQKAIEAAMLRIAKGMEKAIKKALGIKSPSTVMAQLGDFTALGMAQGITRSSKHAVIAARGLAMSVQQGATLTGTPAWAGVSLAGGRVGSHGMVVHNHFHFKIEGNAVTMERLAKDVEAAFLRRGMRNPATYPSYRR